MLALNLNPVTTNTTSSQNKNLHKHEIGFNNLLKP